MADIEQKRWEVYSSVLASTGLTLRYSADASTASYDILKKEVVLPVWECLDEDATQALASHEIGHAKHSDFELSVFKEMTGRYGDLFNVVEDARIERLMKMEFQGLAAIFKAGYRTLADEGKFPLDGIESAPLVERLNAFAKFGFMKDIPFSRDEAAFSYRLMNLSTKADVVDLCEDILAYIESKLERSDMSLAAADGVQQEESKDSERADGEETESSEESSKEADNGCEPDGEGRSETEQAAEHGCQGADIRRELTDERMRQMEHAIASENQKNLAVKNHDRNNDVLVLNSEQVCKAVEAKIKLSELKTWRFHQTARTRRRELAKIAEKVAQTAASMFSQKQSAMLNSTRTKRNVGRIDTRRLAQYGITDALFRQVEKVAKGKSHGVVLLLDYSVSMEDAPGVLLCACMQAAILARFCQMIRIPFSIYLFGCSIKNGWDRWTSHEILKIASEEWLDIDFIIALGFVKHSSLKSAVKIALDGSELILTTGCSTPLLEAVVAGRRDIMKMRNNGIEKPVMFIVTDGAYNDFIHTGEEDCKTAYVLSARKVILDGKSCDESDFKGADRKRLNACGGLAFEILARHLKKETGTDIIFSSIAKGAMFTSNLRYWISAEKDFIAKPSRIFADKLWMRNYIEPYLYKHRFLFDGYLQKSSLSAAESCVVAQASVKNDSIIDLFLMMNTSMLYSIESEAKKIDSADPQDILAWLKASCEMLKAYRGLASAFVEFFA